MANLRPELETTTEQLATKGNEISELSATLNGLTGAHSEDTSDYESRMDDHAAAIEAIDEAIAAMNTLVGSVAGEGIHETSERIAAEKTVGVLAQVKMLSKLASKADQGAVQKIIDLLNDIKANLEASVADEGQGQNQAGQDYDDLKKKMEATLFDL